MNFAQHPLNKIIPRPSAGDYAALRESIREHSQKEPGTIFEGKILDGFTRYQICQELGCEWKHEEFHENGVSAADWVVIKNLDRRHLNHMQRAFSALAYRDMIFSSVAKQSKGFNQHKPSGREPLRYGSVGLAARRFGVGLSSLQFLLEIRRHDKEIFEQVKREEISIRVGIERVRASKEKTLITTITPTTAPTGKPVEIPSVFALRNEIDTFIATMTARGWMLQLDVLTNGRFYAHWHKPGVRPRRDPSTWKILDSEPSFERAIITAAVSIRAMI